MARGVGAALVALVLLAIAGPGAAATPQQKSQQIFRDLADNGRLDGRYTPAQIERALRASSLRRYEQRSDIRPSRSPASSVDPAAADVDDRRSLPFSGIDLALLGGVGAPLLLIGATLGRLARFRTDGELG